MKKKLLQCAIEAALMAGAVLKEGFGTDFKISEKGERNNLVTEYDHKSEKIIIDYIKSKFPDHTFLAEESGYSGAESSEIRWIIDPLDGTVNYAHSLPIFSVSIAAEFKGKVIAGVVFHPMLGELFTAAEGEGAYLNGKKLNVSSVDDLDGAFLVTGFPYNVKENPGYCLNKFVHIVGQGIPVRRLGSAALDLCYVAAGRFDAFWEINLKAWDVAAGILIIKEAGGKATCFDNSEYTLGGLDMLTSNGKIHDVLSEKLIDNSQCEV